MLIAIDVTDARPIYVQIMDEVRRARVLGTLREDEPLPSVRHLAAELRVNPNTVQQAYRELEREGLVYVRRGQGTFASPSQVQDAARRELLRAVAERALHDTHRLGADAETLVQTIRAVATTNSTKEQA